MQRVRIELGRVGEFHDFPEVHHRHTVRDVLHHRQVMGDEQVSQIELCLEILHQVDDLRLNRHIESGYGLVGNNEVWLYGKGSGDTDALPLAPGELVGEALGEVWIEADRVEDVGDPVATFCPLVKPVDRHRLRDDALHVHTRVQRRIRILEDHLHSASEGAQLLRLELRQFRPVEVDRTGRRLVQLQHSPPSRRLSAA